MRAWAVVVAMSCAVGMAACSSSSTSGTAKTGTVTGVLQLGAGNVGGQPRGVQGTITLTKAGGSNHISAKAGTDGTFSVQVPAGSYSVTGQSPMYIINGTEGTCVAAQPTSIVAGQSTAVTVECPTK